MRVGSLFAGVGGFDIAVERAGMEVVWQSENDEHASRVLDHHWPDLNVGDIHDIRLARYTKATRPRYLTDRDKADAVTFYNAGESIGSVASRFAVTRQAMHDILKRRTEMRPNLRYGADNHFHRGTKASKSAHRKVDNAIKRGRLIQPNRCENCQTVPKPMSDGRTRIQAHHDDYDKPLKVRWLCQECHHGQHKPRGEGGQRESIAPAVDVLVGGFP
ncbi:hypothetical protein LCGC14_0984380 [marine sediment metagenome]|uniref:HTH psq-type domain-containing protein n=1 Tax=marine sediment metagenome TaxID=412755 RepID=A0A0F9RE85_9ZZZZ